MNILTDTSKIKLIKDRSGFYEITHCKPTDYRTITASDFVIDLDGSYLCLIQSQTKACFVSLEDSDNVLH